MKDKVVLAIGALLILLGIFKPDLSILKPNPKPDPAPVIDVVTVDGVSDETKEKVKPVVEALKSGSSDRKTDGKRLASLFNDMATLISLDGENEVIKTTEDLRQANAIAGSMLRMEIKDKYPDLGEACTKFVIDEIGDDTVLLDKDLRAKAVNAFKGIAWACNEGSK